MDKKQIAIIGGGAAGYFFAANAARIHPENQYTIYEQAKQGLQKVKVSGGGRCNLTHNCFDPKALAKNYPRGQQELIGPFHRFNPKETIEWFESRGVKTKTEADGRMFPVSNSSQSIIDCLRNECSKYGVAEVFGKKLIDLHPINNGAEGFDLVFKTETKHVHEIMLATGSSKVMWQLLSNLGYQITPPVPSLFTFQIKDDRIKDLPGLAVQNAEVKLLQSDIQTNGPLLITHKGMSGPAILKLSAFGARVFEDRNYKTTIEVNFIPSLTLKQLKNHRDEQGKQLVGQTKFDCPKRLSASLLKASKVDLNKKWASCSNKELEAIYESFCKANFEVIGQNTFKEEFVTAGGVDLSQINFKNFSSKIHENLYFAGELLNIDAVTGGFNFQAAWTGAYLASQKQHAYV